MIESVYVDDSFVIGMWSEWEQCCFIGISAAVQVMMCMPVLSSVDCCGWNCIVPTDYAMCWLHHRVPYLTNWWRLCLPIWFLQCT